MASKRLDWTHDRSSGGLL